MNREKVSTPSEYRSEIAEADAAIIDAIAMRMEIADKLAKAKQEAGQEPWDDRKEHQIISRYRELVSEVNLSEQDAEKIARVILDISKARQARIYQKSSDSNRK